MQPLHVVGHDQERHVAEVPAAMHHDTLAAHSIAHEMPHQVVDPVHAHEVVTHPVVDEHHPLQDEKKHASYGSHYYPGHSIAAEKERLEHDLFGHERAHDVTIEQDFDMVTPFEPHNPHQLHPLMYPHDIEGSYP